jgi:hypothetical protein
MVPPQIVEKVLYCEEKKATATLKNIIVKHLVEHRSSQLLTIRSFIHESLKNDFYSCMYIEFSLTTAKCDESDENVKRWPLEYNLYESPY